MRSFHAVCEASRYYGNLRTNKVLFDVRDCEIPVFMLYFIPSVHPRPVSLLILGWVDLVSF